MGQPPGKTLRRSATSAARPNKSATPYPHALSWWIADRSQPAQLQYAQKTIHATRATGGFDRQWVMR
jgi:hypothetical protein